MPKLPAADFLSDYVSDRYAEIGQAILDQAVESGMTREDVLESYVLTADATMDDIGLQAVLWGDANADGSLN